MPDTTNRRELLAGAAAAAALNALPAAAGSAPLTWVAIGDWGRGGASHQRDVAVQMDGAAAEKQARFVLAVGDNFYDSGVASVDDPQWISSYEAVYTGPALQVPWYVALGNHDYGGSPQAQIDYSKKSARWRMPSRHYKVAGSTIGEPQLDLFVIDTTPMIEKYAKAEEGGRRDNVLSQDVDAQLAWLDSQLAASTAAWKIVAGHHTVHSGGSKHGDTPEMVALLEPILKRRGVQVYINGHDHDMQHIRRGGVDYVCTGCGSEVRPVTTVEGTLFALAESGFSMFTLNGDALALEFRDWRGAGVYQASLPRIR